MRRLRIILPLMIGIAAIAEAQNQALKAGKGVVAPRDPYIGAIVVDAATGQALFEDNSDAPVYPASVVKLMDMLIIIEKIEQGLLKLTDTVKITGEAHATGGTQIWADPKETFTVDDLLYALMVQSANDAAVALAIHVAGSRAAFVELMNRKAAEIGLTGTRYESVHGLPPDTRKGQLPDVTTPRDMTILARELLKHPDVLRYTSTKHWELRGGKTKMDNHNRLLTTVDGCDGLKTGYYRKAGYSVVATVKKNDRRLIAVVMGSLTSRGRVRDAKAAELLSVAFLKPPPPPPTPVVTNSAGAAGTPPVEGPQPRAPSWRMIAGSALATALLLWLVGALVLRRSRVGYREFDGR